MRMSLRMVRYHNHHTICIGPNLWHCQGFSIVQHLLEISLSRNPDLESLHFAPQHHSNDAFRHSVSGSANKFEAVSGSLIMPPIVWDSFWRFANCSASVRVSMVVGGRHDFTACGTLDSLAWFRGTPELILDLDFPIPYLPI